jgi:DNA polymerase III subunit epsilon
MGLTARPAETRLTERAFEFLARGPAHAVPLIEHICQMPGAPLLVAERMALALFADRPEFSRDSEGRWSLVPSVPSSPSAQRRAPRPPVERLTDLSYAVVDLETTGMSPWSGDRITEVAAVVVREGRLIERFSTLINPERPIPPFITRLTHISWEMVKDAPRFADICDELLRLIGGHVFVAHNAEFDWRFLRAEVERATGRRIRGPRLCTVKLARRVLPHLPSRRLDALAFHYGIANEARHRALGDAAATAEILLRLLADAGERECHSWDDLQVLLGARARGNRPRRAPAMPRPVREDGSA